MWLVVTGADSMFRDISGLFQWIGAEGSDCGSMFPLSSYTSSLTLFRSHQRQRIHLWSRSRRKVWRQQVDRLGTRVGWRCVEAILQVGECHYQLVE